MNILPNEQRDHLTRTTDDSPQAPSAHPQTHLQQSSDMAAQHNTMPSHDTTTDHKLMVIAQVFANNMRGEIQRFLPRANPR
jgi:hypothetical protein